MNFRIGGDEVTRTQLIVERNRRRKEIRRKVHLFIVSVAGLIAVTIMILAWTDAAAAEGDTYIKLEYVEYCEEIGQQYGIAPELLEALIEVESSGRADVRSSTGDIGLCQINLKYSKYTEQQLLDPKTNIKASAEILTDLFNKYDMEGLMAYNLGEYSETFREHLENGTLTDYADRIIKRSDYLQELHGREQYEYYR